MTEHEKASLNRMLRATFGIERDDDPLTDAERAHVAEHIKFMESGDYEPVLSLEDHHAIFVRQAMKAFRIDEDDGHRAP